MKTNYGAFTAALSTAITLGTLAGCGGRTYDQDRPPTNSLAAGNVGLQSKDVGAATDRMATDLLALPALNASGKQWTVVITAVTNNTADRTFDYAVFADRLRPLILSKGMGRVALIENKSQYHAVQNQELENPADNMGQGGGDSGHAAGVQPDYGLTVKIDEMPNRATSYFLVTASMTNLQTRQVVWGNAYEVQTAR